MVIKYLKKIFHILLLQPVLRYSVDKTGAIAPLFALLAPILIGFVGGAVDIGQTYLVKQRLTHALDAATLAAAASESDAAAIERKVNQFLELNYPGGRIGNVYDLDVRIEGENVYASAKAHYDTKFIKLLGVNDMNVSVDNGVKLEVQGIEVVLVLDVTGSMAEEIGTLEQSVRMFVNRMCMADECEENVKISYVPFSTAVNVGPYGLGEDEDGNYYDRPFVNNPRGRRYDANDFDQWRGCVEAERNEDTDDEFRGKWDMYRNTETYSTSWYYYNYDSYSHRQYYSYYRRYLYYYHNYNSNCNKSHIIPLTNDKSRLLEKASFNAQGNTLGNLGMVWGLRALTPEYPFTEAAPWTDTTTKRVIVMMTDGKNNIPGGSNGYSAYGPSRNHNMDGRDINHKFSETCQTAKEKYGINVYTITFSNGVDRYTEELFEDCATDPSNYYDVDEAEDLASVYDDIAKELSNLYITN